MKSGIYKIINLITNKFYIGSAVNIIRRWDNHKCSLRLNKHYNKYLQASWNKHGEENFKFEILELCEKDKLIEREQIYIDWFKCLAPDGGYNLKPTAGSCLGWSPSIETRLKMSKSRTGLKRNLEQKLKMSKAQKGRIVSLETKMKKRKLNKWPCDDGVKCKCRECMDRRNEFYYRPKYYRDLNLEHL